MPGVCKSLTSGRAIVTVCGVLAWWFALVVPVNNAEASYLSTVEFSGNVDQVSGNPGFVIKTGDQISGSFSFDLEGIDVNASNLNQGYYHQSPPAGVEITSAGFTFRADVKSFPEYIISVENDDSSVPPTRDVFHWSAGDPNLAASLGVGNLQSNMTLQDLTARAFFDDSLPRDLDIRNFNGVLFVNATNYSASGMPVVVWSIRVKINSIRLKQ